MPQQLRVVDPERQHPRDLARRAVKEFRLDRYKDPEKPLPISNVIDTGAPLLIVNEVIKRTEKVVEDELRPRYHVNPELLMKAIMVAAGLVLLIRLAFSIL
jgi:hypothetical protein